MPISVHAIMLTNGAVATAASLLTNSLLAWLVIKHTPLQMKGYSRLMLMHCVADVLYDFVNFSIGTIVVPLNGQAFNLLQGLFIDIDTSTTWILLSVSNWVSMAAVLLVPIDFVYRYLSVCRNYELSTRFIFFMVFLSYFAVWIFAFPISWTCLMTILGPTAENANYTQLLQKIPEWADTAPPYVLNFKDPSKPDWIVSMYAIAMNVFTLAVIIFTSIKIHLSIKGTAGVVRNAKAMKIHKQVTKILIIQAALPIIIIVGPNVAILACAILQISVPLIGFYSALLTVWFSSIKPIATILIIEKYRKQVRTWICGRNKNGIVETSHLGSSSAQAAAQTRADTRRIQPN